VGEKTLGGCFYKLPSQYTDCPTPTDTAVTATAKPYEHEKVTYCQLSCATNKNCSEKNGGKCLAVPGQTPKAGKS